MDVKTDEHHAMNSASSIGVRAPTIDAIVPQLGESILTLKRCYFDLMLSGAKDLEIRDRYLTPRTYAVGHSAVVFGIATLGAGELVVTDARCKALAPRHHYGKESLPYKHTHALQVSEPKLFRTAVPYVHHRGCIGLCKYEPPPVVQASSEFREPRGVYIPLQHEATSERE